MSEKTLILSAAGLANFDIYAYPDNFTFITKENTYACNRVFADFISPKVMQLHRMDSTANTFTLKCDDSNKAFGMFLSLMHGGEVSISRENSRQLCEIAYELGNLDLLERIFSLDERILDPTNVVEILLEKQALGLSGDEEIQYLLKYFSSVEFLQLSELDVDTLYSILSHNDLRIKDENFLLQFVKMLIDEKGNEYKRLLECVHVEHLTPEAMRQLLDLLGSEDLGGEIWNNLKKRLLLPVSPPKNPRRYCRKTKRLVFVDNPFEGILAHLNKKAKGNAHKAHIVTLTSSSSGHGDISHLIEYGMNGDWGTKNLENSWVKVDLINRQAEFTGYSIMSVAALRNQMHLRSWVVEVSNDDDQWIPVDERVKCNDLNGKLVTKTYLFNKTQPFRYIRLRQTGMNWQSNNYLSISQIEFFGFLLGEQH